MPRLIPSDRHPTAEILHQLVLNYIEKGDDGSQYIVDKSGAGRHQGAAKDGDKVYLGIEAIKMFINLNRNNINDWIADTKHKHTELNRILSISYFPWEGSPFAIPSREERNVRAKNLLSLYEAEIFNDPPDTSERVTPENEKVTPENKKKLLTHSDEKGRSLIKVAIKTGEVDIFRRVIDLFAAHLDDHSIVLELKTRKGFNPLSSAVSSGNIKMVKAVSDFFRDFPLEEIKEQLTMRSQSKPSVLIRALKSGNTDMAKLLIDIYEKHGLQETLKGHLKGDPKQPDLLGAAVDGKNSDMIDLLLGKSIKLEMDGVLKLQLAAKDSKNSTLLQRAVIGGNAEIVDALLKGYRTPKLQDLLVRQLEEKDTDGSTLLQRAVIGGNAEIVDALLKGYRTPKLQDLLARQLLEPDMYGNNMLMASVRSHNPEVFSAISKAILVEYSPIELLEALKTANHEGIDPIASVTESKQAAEKSGNANITLGDSAIIKEIGILLEHFEKLAASYGTANYTDTLLTPSERSNINEGAIRSLTTRLPNR